MNKIFNTVIRLRRDTEQNFDVIGSTFVPMLGEVCIVETSKGLRAKVGDGHTNFRSLEYVSYNNDIVLRGYLLNGKFYTDSTYQVELEKNENAIYININDNSLYSWNGTEFVSGTPYATDSIAGIMKLYSENGVNEDGTMTQKAISNGIGSIKFGIDKKDDECLILDLPW